MSSKTRVMAVLMGVALLGMTTAQAAFEYTWTDGPKEAKALFEQIGDDLKVTLINSSTADSVVPMDSLHAVFFSLADLGGVLTPISALLPAGTIVEYGSFPTGGNVGGEWAFADGLSVGDATLGISSAGYGLFGGPNFNGPNLTGPDAVNGLDWGIVSAGDDINTANGGLLNGPQIKNSVVFMLDLPDTYTLTAGKISGVQFQYGTDLTIPEPTSFVLAVLGLSGAGLLLRRRS